MSIDGWRRHLAAGITVELHEDEVQISSQRPHSHDGSQTAAVQCAGRPKSQWISEHGPQGPVSPEVVVLSEMEQALGRNAHAFVPDAMRLVVVAEHRDSEAVGWQPELLDRSPRKLDRALLEVVAKREFEH